MSDEAVTQRSAEKIAEACAQAIWKDDRASHGLGMRIEEIHPGYSRLSMAVREDMVNGHANCHGGFIFTLADSSFAFACNYKNHVTVASGASIDYVAPVKLGDVLTATCRELSRSGRTGVYDATVENQEGRLVALFRGKSYQTKGQNVPGLEVDGE